jgi:hypothetical protein
MDTSQAELEEEEAISGTGEGDEIMEEAEEQEGYSGYPIVKARSSSSRAFYIRPARGPLSLFLTDFDLLLSFVDANINTDMDQLVLFITRT